MFNGVEVMPFFVVQQRMAKKMHQAVPAWIPHYIALAVQSKAQAGISFFLILTPDVHIPHPSGCMQLRHEILFTKNKIYTSPEDSKASVLDKTENSKIIGSYPTKSNRKFNGRYIELL